MLNWKECNSNEIWKLRLSELFTQKIEIFVVVRELFVPPDVANVHDESAFLGAGNLEPTTLHRRNIDCQPRYLVLTDLIIMQLL